jgi:NAD(P)-dependent dehydrogenase (short-subunit alcohol dehydrogenase family)
MDGKTCLVTGANRGIGKVVAQELARLGARVIVAARNPAKLGEACLAIQSQGASDVLGISADLSSWGSIRKAVDQLSAHIRHLDVLVNNAATIPTASTMTGDGVETQFAVNHLGPFLLTNLLLPQLLAAPSGRIVNVSSNAHFHGRLQPDMLSGQAGAAGGRYQKQRRYKATKLANVLFTYALARRLRGTRVTVNAVRPGTINTGLVRDFLRPFGFLRWLFLFNTTSRGAAPIVWLATDVALEGVTGCYFDRFRKRRSSVATYDERLQEELWRHSAQLTGLGTQSPEP